MIYQTIFAMIDMLCRLPIRACPMLPIPLMLAGIKNDIAAGTPGLFGVGKGVAFERFGLPRGAAGGHSGVPSGIASEDEAVAVSDLGKGCLITEAPNSGRQMMPAGVELQGVTVVMPHAFVTPLGARLRHTPLT
jgi:hypothetical protein